MAREEAEKKKPDFVREYKTPEGDWVQWIDDHLVFDASIQCLSFKITARTIEFGAWMAGFGSGIKINMVDSTVETYTGYGAKLNVGVKVCDIGAKAEGKADFIRKTAKWDFENGKYSESWGSKGEIKGSFGPLSAGAKMEIDTELNAKASLNAGFSRVSAQEQYKFSN